MRKHNRFAHAFGGIVILAMTTPLLAGALVTRYSIDFERDLNQSAYHADTPALSPTGAMTIEAWINPETLPSAGRVVGIVSKWTTLNCCLRSYHFGLVNLGGVMNIYAHISSDGSGDPGKFLTTIVPVNLATGTWHHVAIVFIPGTRVEFFVDGISVGHETVGVPMGVNDNPAEFTIGAGIDENGPSNFFDGKIDDVRLWGVARTQAEIIDNMNLELTGTEPGLLGYWKFNGDAFDSTANGNHLSLRNGPVYSLEGGVNHAPIFAPIGNMTVSEGQTLSFGVSATDEDGDALTYSASNLPPGATFDSQTRTFSWTPTYSQGGNYPGIEFAVTDSGSPMELDVETITITVGNVNRAPVFDAISPQEVLENTQLQFGVSAVDPDGDNLVLSASGLPNGATFSGGTFSWTPSLSESGVYVVMFVATDDGIPAEVGTTDVVITVGDNPTPTEQSVALVNVVVNYDFPTNVENSYLANLKKIEKFITNGQVAPAINQLNAFIAKVENDYTAGILTRAQRDSLVSLANKLLGALGG